MSRAAVTNLESELKKGQVIAPYVYDCLTARMAENTGYKTFVISMSSVAMTYGLPDKNVLTCDDMIQASARIADFLPYPVITEFGNGFGETPYAVYNNVTRLKMAGTAGVMIDDTTNVPGRELAEEEVFLAKIAAAVKACEGSGMKVIAVTRCRDSKGIPAAVERLLKCRALGAGMVCCGSLATTEECRTVAEQIDGPKMFDDFTSDETKQTVDLDAISGMGYQLVTIRYVEKASLYGLMQYGLRCRADNDTVYVDYHDFDGLLPEVDHHIRLTKHWWEMEKMLKDLSVLDQAAQKGGER